MAKSLVVDADGHIVEPADLWLKRLPEKYRRNAMQVAWNPATQQEMVVGEGRIILDRGVVGVGMAGRPYTDLGSGVRYSELLPGGTDPRERTKDMDRDGMDVAVLYPSLGLFMGALHDPGLAAAHCRAYNEWLAEYCQTSPQRLVGIALAPMQDAQLAIAELRYAVKDLGLRGVFLRPNPHNGRHLFDRYFDPFWAEAQDLGVPVALHPSGTPDMWGAPSQLQIGVPVVSHPLGFQIDDLVCFSGMIGSGLCQRFPRLQIAVLESGGGWIVHWFDRMDHFYQVYSWQVPHLKLKPSEYFRRQCYISFDPDEKSLPALVDIIGEDTIVWASDYPHLDATYPGVVEELRANIAGLPPRAQRKVLGENAARLYGLKEPVTA